MGIPKKLLIVDDDPNITKILCARFKADGNYEAIGVNDPRQALQKIQSDDIRIVVTDIDMPVKSGLELLAEIKSYDATIQVIMITGYDTLGNLTSAFQEGAEYIVLKPIKDFGELSARIDRCYEKLNHWSQVIESARQKRD